MAKFELNPLKWFKQRVMQSPSASPSSSAILKPAAKPRKSGNVFMHLITFQKTLQSMDLAFRQQIDFTWLVQKAVGQLSLLKLEAETVAEDELAEASSQVEAYFETVCEGRLDFDDVGLEMLHEFVSIFKEAIGEGAPGMSSLDHPRLGEWNVQYQSLMAQMKPITEDTRESSFQKAELSEQEIGDLESEATTDADVHVAGTEEVWEPDRESTTEPPAKPFADFTAGVKEDSGFGVSAEGPASAGETEDSSEYEEFPSYDPSETAEVRDDVIADAEIRTAREYIELGLQKPEVELEEAKPREEHTRPPGREPRSPTPVTAIPRGVDPPKSPVQLDEVERLKGKLFELHERQEQLSSRMTGLLGDIKKAVGDSGDEEERASIENFDIDDLEELIFIGRKKG